MAQEAQPLDLPAPKIASGIRTRKFLASDVVAESLRRAQEIAGKFNPFTVIRTEKAMAVTASEVRMSPGPLCTQRFEGRAKLL